MTDAQAAVAARFDTPFFEAVRKPLFGGTLSQAQVDGLDATARAWGLHGDGDLRKLAYILATIHHETGTTFAAVAENLNYTTASRIAKVWPSIFANADAARAYVRNPEALANHVYGRGKKATELGNTMAGDGWRFRGRGPDQITGRRNYARFSEWLGVDLVSDPDKALNVGLSCERLVYGMLNGIYTGKKLGTYITADAADFVNARRTVNGVFEARKVAALAEQYLAALKVAPPVAVEPPPETAPAPPRDIWAALWAIVLRIIERVWK